MLRGWRSLHTIRKPQKRPSTCWPDLNYASSAEEATKDADALVLLTEWPSFRDADFAQIHRNMVRPLILDGRNLLDPAKLTEMGFEYVSMGRPKNAGVVESVRQPQPVSELRTVSRAQTA